MLVVPLGRRRHERVGDRRLRRCDGACSVRNLVEADRVDRRMSQVLAPGSQLLGAAVVSWSGGKTP